MTAIVLQARLDSSRLPQKSLLPMAGKPLIFRVMEALNRVPCDLRVLACPEDSLALFSPLAKEASFEVMAGPKDDVLERYCMAIRRFGIDRVIRATGDNPFVFADAAEAIDRESAALGASYGAYQGLPYGAGVESVAAEALLRAGQEAGTPYDREHVCPYLYSHGESFLLHRPLVPLPWRKPSLRITVDTPGDYQHAEIFYRSLSQLFDAEQRYRGENIIAAYRKTFNSSLSEIERGDGG